jgi:hypothetical protein
LRVKQNQALREGCTNFWKPGDVKKSEEKSKRPIITPLGDHSYVDSVIHEIDHEEIVSTSHADVTDISDWKDGRRIVELDTLAKNLEECRRCGQPLHLSDCVGETRFGLAQILLDTECRLVNDVPTDLYC